MRNEIRLQMQSALVRQMRLEPAFAILKRSITVHMMMHLLNAIGLPPDGSSTVHIYAQTIHRTTQLTTLVGRLSGIRTQSGQNTINDELTA